MSSGAYASAESRDPRRRRRPARRREPRAARCAAALPAEPVWLEQVHGANVLDLEARTLAPRTARSPRQAGVVCAVLTADCLPVLLCDSRRRARRRRARRLARAARRRAACRRRALGAARRSSSRGSARDRPGGLRGRRGRSRRAYVASGLERGRGFHAERARPLAGRSVRPGARQPRGGRRDRPCPAAASARSPRRAVLLASAARPLRPDGDADLARA